MEIQPQVASVQYCGLQACTVFYPSVQVRAICVQNLKVYATSGQQLHSSVQHVQFFKKFHGNQKSPTRMNGSKIGIWRWLELKTLSTISVWGKLFYDLSEDLDLCVLSSTEWTCLGRSTHFHTNATRCCLQCYEKICSFVFSYSGTCNLRLHSVIIQKIKIYNLTVKILNFTSHNIYLNSCPNALSDTRVVMMLQRWITNCK